MLTKLQINYLSSISHVIMTVYADVFLYSHLMLPKCHLTPSQHPVLNSDAKPEENRTASRESMPRWPIIIIIIVLTSYIPHLL